MLTHLLMDALAIAPKSRIVNVSARLHEQGTINFSDLMGDKDYSSLQAYSNSKLANILFTRELAKRLSGKFVFTLCSTFGIVNCPCRILHCTC